MLLIAILTIIFALLGAIGMGEAGMVLVPLAITLSLALGYDKMVGAAAGTLGMGVGFTSGVLNTFTTGVSQAIAGLPLFSAITFRIVAFIVFTAITIIYILIYARKIKNDPSQSVITDGSSNVASASSSDFPMNTQRILIIIAFLIVIFFQIYGSLQLGWYLPELSAIYLMLGVAAGLIYRMNLNDLATTFATGASKILPAALAIAFARSVVVVMEEGQVLDTAIYQLAQFLDGRNPLIIVTFIFIATIVFNFFIVSGSGKAVILMPILSPLGRLMGINQQVMVVAFQFGDGFSNYFWPTSGGLMAGLALADVKYSDWARFTWKFMVMMHIVGLGFIIVAQLIGLGPF